MKFKFMDFSNKIENAPTQKFHHGVARLTDGLSSKELSLFDTLGEPVEYKQEEVAFYENSFPDAFYIILEGHAEIVKKTTDSLKGAQEHIITTLKEHEVIGDMALIEKKPRAATVRAKTTLKLLKYSIEGIKANLKIYAIVTKNLAQMLSERLRYTNEVTIINMQSNLKQALARNVLGVFMIVMFWLSALYTLSLTTLIKLDHTFVSSTLLSQALIVIYMIVMLYAMKLTELEFEHFGITLKNWKKISFEAILYTLPLVLIYLLIKVYIIYFSSNPNHLVLFSGTDQFFINGVFLWKVYTASLIIYILLSPAQELIARCALQSTFALFLPGKKAARKWNSILLPNVMFSAAHSHLGLTFAASTFIPGVFWGWLFAKQRSIVGVSLSHILLGVSVIFIIGGKNLW